MERAEHVLAQILMLLALLAISWLGCALLQVRV